MKKLRSSDNQTVSYRHSSVFFEIVVKFYIKLSEPESSSLASYAMKFVKIGQGI